MDRIDTQSVERLRWAVAALPKRTQAVFRLHVIEGIDYATIAELLRIDALEVERLLAEAIVALGNALAAHGGP